MCVSVCVEGGGVGGGVCVCVCERERERERERGGGEWGDAFHRMYKINRTFLLPKHSISILMYNISVIYILCQQIVLRVHGYNGVSSMMEGTRATISKLTPNISAMFNLRRRTLLRNTTASTALMFTSFSDNPKKQKLFLNTIKNWATFLPAIQPVLFTSNPNSSLNTLATKHGWIVTPCPAVNEFGIPFVKNMYLKAYSIMKSQFYAFANGDILFDGGLVESLNRIGEDIPTFNTTLISGKRHNYDSKNCTKQNLEIWTQEHVHNMSKHSPLAREWCEDYFFVTPDIPWDKFKDVVIARELYDNYLVHQSKVLNITTVDITETITALHQCTTLRDRNAKAISQKDRDYNRLLIGVMGSAPIPNGLTNRMKLKTIYNQSGKVTVVARKLQT